MRTRKIAFAFLGLLGVVAGLGVPASHAAVPTVATTTSSIHQVEITGDVNGHVVKKVDGQVVPASPSTAQYSIYTYLQFRGNYVCQDNNIGTTFPLESAGDWFEQGGSHVVLAMAGVETPANCTNYPDSQTIHYSIYNNSATYAPCWKLSGSFNAVSQPNYWTGNVQAQINNYWSDCKSDAVARGNTTSSLTGNALGLTAYNNTVDRCVMNRVMVDIAWAQPCDTSRLHWIY